MARPSSSAHYDLTETEKRDLTIAVKVIDIFGNDTMTLIPVTVG